jgi:type I restriction enzyme S subunit
MEPIPTEESFVPVVGGNGVLGYTDQSTFSFPVPLVTCRGSRCGLMQWAKPPTWISNNAMAVYFKANQGDDFFLHQYLLNSSFDDVTTGSAQPQITVTNLSLKRILLPDLQTQKYISSLMKNIEEKIATNNILSKSLEDIAQTIFKSWFIDFDPVKAKMAGEKPAGMDASTALLFPDSMEESELGLIPTGWNVLTLEHLSQISKKSLNPQSYTSTEFSHYSIPAFDSGMYPTYTAGEKILSGKYIVDGPSVLVSKLNPQTQRIWTVPKPHKNGICSTEFIVLTAILEESFSFINQIVKGVRFQEAYVGMATGSTGSRQRVRPDEILKVPIVVADIQIIRAFSDVTIQMFQEIDLLQEQNQSLINLRNAFLPRLISGELQIPEEMLAS